MATSLARLGADAIPSIRLMAKLQVPLLVRVLYPEVLSHHYISHSSHPVSAISKILIKAPEYNNQATHVSRVRLDLTDKVLTVTATDPGGWCATVVGSTLAGLHRPKIRCPGALRAVGIAVPHDVLGNEVAGGKCLAAIDWSGGSA